MRLWMRNREKEDLMRGKKLYCLVSGSTYLVDTFLHCLALSAANTPLQLTVLRHMEHHVCSFAELPQTEALPED